MYFLFLGTLLVPIDIRVSSYNSNLDVSRDASHSSLEVPSSSYYSDSSSYTETNIDNSSENVIPKIADELKKSSASSQRQRRRLVRQKVVSERPPAVDKCILLNLYELSESKKKSGSGSQSQPSLLVQNKDGQHGCEICKCKMSNVGCRSVAKHNPLHRSQSSGAEKVKFRDRHFAQRRGGRERRSRVYVRNVSDASNASSLTRDNSVSQIEKHVTLSPDHSEQSAPIKSPNRPYPQTRDSTLDSGSFDWSADEAACDEEVRLITGTPPETEDEIITPAWTKESNSNNDCSICSTVVQSEASPSSSDCLNPLGNMESTPTNSILSSHSLPSRHSPIPPSHLSVDIPAHSSQPSSSYLSPNTMRNSPEKLSLPTSLMVPRSPKPSRLSPLFLAVPVFECKQSDNCEQRSPLFVPRVNTPVPSRNIDNVSHNSISPSGADGQQSTCDKHLADSDQSTSVIIKPDSPLSLRRRLHPSLTQEED